MNTFAVDYRMSVPEFDTVVVQADDREEAEMLAKQEAQTAWPEASDFEVIEVRESF